MSRPQKIHKPLHAPFGKALEAIAMGSGKGKATAKKLAVAKGESAKGQNQPPK